MSIDIKALASSGVDLAFSQLSQLLEEVVLTKSLNAAYDPVTDTTSGDETVLTVNGIFVDIKKYDGRYVPDDQIAGDAVQVGDQELLLKGPDVTLELGSGVKVFKVSDSTNWQIVNFELDPTKSLYKVHVRKSS